MIENITAIVSFINLSACIRNEYKKVRENLQFRMVNRSFIQCTLKRTCVEHGVYVCIFIFIYLFFVLIFSLLTKLKINNAIHHHWSNLYYVSGSCFLSLFLDIHCTKLFCRLLINKIIDSIPHFVLHVWIDFGIGFT